MGVEGGARRRRQARVYDDAGAPRRDTGKPHGEPVGLTPPDPRLRQSMIQPTLLAPATTVKPGQSAIGMAQRAQRGGNPFNGLKMKD